MSRQSKRFANRDLSLGFVLLVAMLLVVWAAGGASRADVIGQVFVRAAAWVILIAAILFTPRPDWRPIAPISLLLISSAGLVAVQLIPLPPSIWTSLPGREVLAQTAIVIDQPQPWRPISISPGASINALSSLIVPAIVLYLFAGLNERGHKRIHALLLGLVIASSLIGLMQFSGSRFDNPFVNDLPGFVDGTFANRNHFALFLACGCILAPCWAFSRKDAAPWKPLAAIGLTTIFVLVILATGSRAGIVVGFVGVSLGILAVRSRLQTVLRALPRKVWLSATALAAAFLGLTVFLSVKLDRAVAVDRAAALSADDDLRTEALPTIWQMMVTHFPVGAGFGTFDPVFRIYEPDDLLGPSYWNHAHNDWAEVILDGGLLAIVILVAASAWWLKASLRAWRAPFEGRSVRARAGSSILFLIGLASLVDYPARTPLIMALMVIAAGWLAANGFTMGRTAAKGGHLKRS